MIFFKLILTTFESRSIFGGSWGSIENRLEAKIEPPSGNLAFPNLCRFQLNLCRIEQKFSSEMMITILRKGSNPVV